MDFASYLGELDAARWGPENRVVLARVDSTNRLARRVVSAYQREEMAPPELLVLALEQVAGRGRQGRSWSSPPGGGVYATRVLTVADPAALQTVPLLAAVGLAGALGRLLPAGRCGLKWPNDLMVDGRKLGGVLVESIARAGEASVAMIGFGVNYRSPATEEPGRTTSLAEQLPSPPPLGELAKTLVIGLDRELRHLGDEPYAAARFEALSIHRPGDALRCRVAGEVVEGGFGGFDERGFLRLETPEGERLISAGEIVETNDRPDED